MSTLFTLAQDHKLFAWRMKQRKEQEREERKKAHFSRKRGIITPRKKGGRGMSEEFAARVNELLKKEQDEAYSLLQQSSASLENLAKSIKNCADDFREDATNSGKSLQVYVATHSVDSVLNALLYRLKKCRDKMGALLELKKEEAEE